jgi:septal ring factor EnvC (AmiA/AmiB activator)
MFKEKFKLFWSSTIGKYVIVALIVIISIPLLYFGLKGPSSAYFQKMLDQQMAKEKAKYAQEIKEKDKELKINEKTIKELNKQLQTSKVSYLKIKKQLDDLDKEVANVTEPKDIKEVKDRLRDMGYTVK